MEAVVPKPSTIIVIMVYASGALRGVNIGFSRRYRLGPPSVGTGIDASTEALILGRLNVQSSHALTHISLTILHWSVILSTY